MRLSPNQISTRLGTTRRFLILRPEGLRFVTEIKGDLTNTIVSILRDQATGKWRIDKYVTGNLWESIPGLDGLYDKPEIAAKALVERFPQ
jgi:hypothetical protein